MKAFTSSLPDSLLDRLAEAAKAHNTAKNKIIENALQVYLEQLEKAEYIKSYRQAGEDDDIMQVAEEGVEAYLTNLAEPT